MSNKRVHHLHTYVLGYLMFTAFLFLLHVVTFYFIPISYNIGKSEHVSTPIILLIITFDTEINKPTEVNQSRRTIPNITSIITVISIKTLLPDVLKWVFFKSICTICTSKFLDFFFITSWRKRTFLATHN